MTTTARRPGRPRREGPVSPEAERKRKQRERAREARAAAAAAPAEVGPGALDVSQLGVGPYRPGATCATCGRERTSSAFDWGVPDEAKPCPLDALAVHPVYDEWEAMELGLELGHSEADLRSALAEGHRRYMDALEGIAASRGWRGPLGVPVKPGCALADWTTAAEEAQP